MQSLWVVFWWLSSKRCVHGFFVAFTKISTNALLRPGANCFAKLVICYLSLTFLNSTTKVEFNEIYLKNIDFWKKGFDTEI